ncbi:MAG TPA: PfkB family carbohydrate kinase [Polyangiaceae bacterium]|nr:PfkB family carbohydrate kinase [Polyangiaceae bacterium]
MPASSLLIIGSMAFDDLDLPSGEFRDVVGGSATYSAFAASHFTEPRVVAVVGDDFPEPMLGDLARCGVDVSGIERARGKTFRWWGRYAKDLVSRTTLDTQLNVFADFKPKLPEAWRDGEFLFLGNIHPTLQLDVLTQVKKPRLVAMDTMNFWIEGEPAALAKVLERVDLLVINDEEARLLSKEHNLPRAARAIRAMGPKTVIVKRGESGALLFHEHGVFAAPAYPLERVVDPTGAGDTFAGGFMGYLARVRDVGPQAVRRAMFYGSVMASFCVEDYSLDRLRTLSDGEIEGRYRAFRDLTHFEDVRL